MKLLINDKEIIEYLASLVTLENVANDIVLPETRTAEIVGWICMLKEDPKKLKKRMPKIKDKIRWAVQDDLGEYVGQVKEAIKKKREIHGNVIRKKLEYVIEQLGEETLLKNYAKSKIENYVKSIGLAIDPTADLIRRKKFNSVDEDCVLRNTVGNETLLVNKIDNSKPFWFIDSGYTNFLENNKKWHRLVRNHLHYSRNFSAPVDRLGMFKTFPQPWRTGGEKILVIEPGLFAASIFHVDIKQWKYNVEKELRNYTDKKIVFREKAPKKTRSPLYEHLCKGDYYCVININSNAATEAIWAGVPVITLDRHITNPVARNKLSDINNLYRGSLAEWMTMLSYSQFTFEELMNGSALKIIREYHE